MLLATAALAAPGIPSYWDDFHLAPAPIIKAAPVLAPAPWHPPVFAHAPAIVKPVVPVPVVKTIAAPTSYDTVTQLHVAHPPVIKVIAL